MSSKSLRSGLKRARAQPWRGGTSPTCRVARIMRLLRLVMQTVRSGRPWAHVSLSGSSSADACRGHQTWRGMLRQFLRKLTRKDATFCGPARDANSGVSTEHRLPVRRACLRQPVFALPRLRERLLPVRWSPSAVGVPQMLSLFPRCKSLGYGPITLPMLARMLVGRVHRGQVRSATRGKPPELPCAGIPLRRYARAPASTCAGRAGTRKGGGGEGVVGWKELLPRRKLRQGDIEAC